MGFFAMELNAGWAEWTSEALPIHAGPAEEGGFRCECSKLP